MLSIIVVGAVALAYAVLYVALNYPCSVCGSASCWCGRA